MYVKVIKANQLNEGRLQSLFGTGTKASSLATKVGQLVQAIKQGEESSGHKTVWSSLDPYGFKYDAKKKAIVYTKDADSLVTGIYKDAPIVKVELSEMLSDREIKKFMEELAKTKLGKEAQQYSKEAQEEKRKKEEAQQNSPEYLAKELVTLVRDYFNEQKWNNSDKGKNDLLRMGKILSHTASKDKAFVKTYEEGIAKEERSSTKLQANAKVLEKVDDLRKTVGAALDKL